MTLTDKEVLDHLDQTMVDFPNIKEEVLEISESLLDHLDTMTGKTLNSLWIALASVERTVWERLKSAVIYTHLLEKEGCPAAKKQLNGKKK